MLELSEARPRGGHAPQGSCGEDSVETACTSSSKQPFQKDAELSINSLFISKDKIG